LHCSEYQDRAGFNLPYRGAGPEIRVIADL
jgi:hypothetical protein